MPLAVAAAITSAMPPPSARTRCPTGRSLQRAPADGGFVDEFAAEPKWLAPGSPVEPLTRAGGRVSRRLASMATLQELADGLHLSRKTVTTRFVGLPQARGPQPPPNGGAWAGAWVPASEGGPPSLIERPPVAEQGNLRRSPNFRHRVSDAPPGDIDGGVDHRQEALVPVGETHRSARADSRALTPSPLPGPESQRCCADTPCERASSKTAITLATSASGSSNQSGDQIRW